MVAQQGTVGVGEGRADHPGLLARATATLKQWLGIGWTNVPGSLPNGPPVDCPTDVTSGSPADSSSGLRSAIAPAGGAALQAEGHHAHYTVEELDACIEDSFRHGDVDLYAAWRRPRRHDDEQAPAAQVPPVARRAKSTRLADQREAKAFGGDLYPTAAHGADHHVRHHVYVRPSAPQHRRRP